LETQAVKINAELLHFHSTLPALESSMGGTDRIGAKSAAHASVGNATMSRVDQFPLLRNERIWLRRNPEI
jgi:hypothetical protein